jgi:protein-glutamine gamma-glutamyltransferase
VRFSAIHKLASYLMAACAFGAVAAAEELSSIVLIAAAVGMAASWFWEPPRVRPERWTVWWNAAALAAFGYTVLSAFAGASWITGGAQLLLFLLVAKLFNRRSSRDYQWVYVVSFLLLVAGTTLNAEVSYAVCFLGYVIFATWALILFHLRREMEDNFLLKHSDDSSSERVEVERILNSRRIVGTQFLLGTSSISLVIFVGSALLFLLFPRVGFGLFFRGARSEVTLMGLSDTVQLGGHGLILDDDTVVMRAQIDDPRWRGVAAPAIHWRAVAFDLYSQGRWSRSRAAMNTQFDAQLDGRKTRLEIGTGDPRPNGQWRPELLRQEVYLEPLDTPALIGADEPVGFELEHINPGQFTGRGRVGANGEVRFHHNGPLRYVVYSDVQVPMPSTLRAAPDADPMQFRPCTEETGKNCSPYLYLPPELPKRVRDMAFDVTRDAVGPYDKAKALEHYLRGNYGYTLEMESKAGREPLDYFLFDRKMGHCEYFASAMAIMLRAIGIPSRNVNGFLGGEWNEYGGYVAVRAGDAHSWVEVWIQGAGWVTFDPTPPGVPTPLSRGGGGVLGKLRRMMDTLRLEYFKWVIGYDLDRQRGLMKRLSKSLGFDSGLSAKAFKAWIKRNKWSLLGVLGGIIGLVAFRRWWKRRGQPRVAAEARRTRPPSHPVVLLHGKMARKLARQGFPRPPGETPREHASRLGRSGAPGAEPFAELTELYYTVRFSESASLSQAVDVESARRLATSIDEALTVWRKSGGPPAKVTSSGPRAA